MEDRDALRTYCRRMITQVHTQHSPETTTGETERRRRRERESAPRPTEPIGGRDREGRRQDKEMESGHREPRFTLPGPASQPVPLQLISVLKLKSFTEQMKRAADIELHNPSLCDVCVQKKAALALKTFIRRKKTLLDAHTLDDRLQTHLCNRDSICLLGELLRHIPKPSDTPNKIWEQLQAKDRLTQQS